MRIALCRFWLASLLMLCGSATPMQAQEGILNMSFSFDGVVNVAKIDVRLTGGAREYSLYDSGILVYCGRPRIMNVACQVR